MTTRRNLSVELRPQRLSEMVGQDALIKSIRNTFSGGAVPVLVLLTGSFGAGKTTIAQILALSFNCTHQVQFGEPCDACLENEAMFNIIEYNCAVKSTKEETIELIKSIQSYPNFGTYKVIFLDEIQRLSDAAQQALLKELETGEASNIFIAGTTNPEKINDGIKGRSIPFAVPELTPKGVEAVVANTMRLAKERYQIESRDPAPLIHELYTATITSSRNIVTATELYLSGMPAANAIVVKEAGDVDFAALNVAVGQGQWSTARAILSNAKPVEAAQVKMRLSAYFRFKLLATPSGPRADLLSLFIKELGDASAVESGLELSLVVSCVYRICQTIESVKNKVGSNNPVLIKAA